MASAAESANRAIPTLATHPEIGNVRRDDALQPSAIPVSGHRYTPDLVSEYQDSRQQREHRRRTMVRVVCVVIAVAMLGSLVIPAIYAGL
ncbi:hypothetical protein DF196_09005 [Bifidobacterium callitrichidarum]|uniref:Uncharacterized protein n=1 Tax=Bifidobacterium callitrichidarum TaxID=2052941 RepID=A0A2U2N5A2_9BIFI|nr:hypothetical protein DF196_09005 [Bifidobacterium callitrichidarum]